VGDVPHHMPAAGSRHDPALEIGPKALHAARAADIFVSHDCLPFCCEPRFSMPSGMSMRMRREADLDKAKASRLP
jgi:hypothetical protein